MFPAVCFVHCWYLGSTAAMMLFMLGELVRILCIFSSNDEYSKDILPVVVSHTHWVRPCNEGQSTACVICIFRMLSPSCVALVFITPGQGMYKELNFLVPFKCDLLWFSAANRIIIMIMLL